MQGLKHREVRGSVAVRGPIHRRTLTIDREPPGEKHSMRFYTTERLGTSQSVTPEGFLLCENVPLARVGSQIYGEHELPGLKGRDGLITIHRDEAEVFRPETVASFNGKPVTNDHPPEKVTPDNWRSHSVGVVLNPRRGDGASQDNALLFGDLLITDREAIDDVRSGKREVSAGYDAEYEQTQDGEGRQYQIIGNHVALVRKGRCGPMCSIGDEQMAVRNRLITRSRTGFKDRIVDAMQKGTLDAALVEELDRVDEMLGEQVSGEGTRDEGRVVINLHHGQGGGGMGEEPTKDQPEPGAAPASAAGATPAAASEGGEPSLAEVMQRLDRIEQAIVILAQGDQDEDNPDENTSEGEPGGEDTGFGDEAATEPDSDEPALKPANSLPYGAGTTNDRHRRIARRATTRDHAGAGGGQRFVGDSANMADEFRDTVARAEMLVAGFSVPTFDAKKPARMTFDALCSLRRNVLDRAYHDQDKRGYIDAMLGGQTPNFRDSNAMTCDALALVFNGASELARQDNNRTMGRARGAGGGGFAPTISIGDMNKRNREKYGIV